MINGMRFLMKLYFNYKFSNCSAINSVAIVLSRRSAMDSNEYAKKIMGNKRLIRGGRHGFGSIGDGFN